MSGELRVEATGETVAEAKWNALRELELIAPSLEKTAVAFEVVSEGARGLLGVGYEPARVSASAPPPSDWAAAGERRAGESSDGARLRGVLERVTAALGVRCRIDISDSGGVLIGTCVGDDLGLLIGRQGQTLDALQLLAAAMLQGSSETTEVIVDAAGYRARRRERLEELALRSAEEALRTGGEVELEAMSSSERKLVHTYLEHHAGILTASRGAEPHRCVVISPA